MGASSEIWSSPIWVSLQTTDLCRVCVCRAPRSRAGPLGLRRYDGRSDGSPVMVALTLLGFFSTKWVGFNGWVDVFSFHKNSTAERNEAEHNRKMWIEEKRLPNKCPESQSGLVAQNSSPSTLQHPPARFRGPNRMSARSTPRSPTVRMRGPACRCSIPNGTCRAGACGMRRKCGKDGRSCACGECLGAPFFRPKWVLGGMHGAWRWWCIRLGQETHFVTAGHG